MAKNVGTLKLSWTHVVAVLLAFVAIADIATGNSDRPLLPAFVTNILTQQTDFILLAASAFLFFFVS